MKKSNTTAKLKLTRETLKLLQDARLKQAVGGVEVTRNVACPIGTAQTDCG
jgi:hypothetical protein